MQHTLWFSRRSRGVEDEHRIFGVQFLGFAVGRLPIEQFVVPDVPLIVPIDIAVGALEHHAMLDRRAGFQGRVGVCLERDLAAAAHALVRRDDQIGIAVLDTPGQGVRREPAEDDRMDRADPSAREHGNSGFRHHGHINRDAVALLDAERLQAVGKPAHFLMKLAIRDRLGVFRIVAFPDDCGLVAARVEMPVETIVGCVQDTVFEPFDMDVAAEIDVLDLGRILEPGNAFRLLGPEPLGVLDRLLVHVEVGVVVGPGLFGPVLRDRIDVFLHSLPPLNECGFLVQDLAQTSTAAFVDPSLGLSANSAP